MFFRLGMYFLTQIRLIKYDKVANYYIIYKICEFDDVN